MQTFNIICSDALDFKYISGKVYLLGLAERKVGPD